jgi:hypothetical protein
MEENGLRRMHTTFYPRLNNIKLYYAIKRSQFGFQLVICYSEPQKLPLILQISVRAFEITLQNLRFLCSNINTRIKF